MIDIKDIYSIIVVYNKECKDSITFNCLKEVQDLNIIVCDNSTSDYGNKDYVESLGYSYISMCGNKGLPKAYNKAISTIKAKQGYICLFDDDTSIPADYFTTLIRDANSSNSDILLPIVYDEIGIMSPTLAGRYAIKRISNLDQLANSSISAINSGMAIKIDCFENYRYNEEMFLDFVDHEFMKQMRNQNKKISIMDIKIKQSFSANVNSKQSDISRIKILKKDLKLFYKDTFLSRFYGAYVILKRKAKLTIKHKEPRFLFI